MPADRVYCGIKDPIPRGYKKRGDMVECASKRFGVAYYGIKRIDPIALNEGLKKQVKGPTPQQIFIKVAGATGAKNRLEENIKYEKDIKKKAALQKELDAVLIRLRGLRLDYKKAVDAQNGVSKTLTNNKNSKKGLKRPSKKVSKEASKKLSKKTSKKVSKKASKKLSKKASKKVSKKASKKVSKKASKKVSKKKVLKK